MERIFVKYQNRFYEFSRKGKAWKPLKSYPATDDMKAVLKDKYPDAEWPLHYAVNKSLRTKIKIMALKSNDSCLQKAAEDEPIFVLRGQDVSAAKTVIHWIAKNFDTCPDDKLREAFEQALKMKNYPKKKIAD